MLPQKILKNKTLGNAIFGHFCDITVNKFRSAFYIHTPPISMKAYSLVIHDSFSHLSLFMIPKF